MISNRQESRESADTMSFESLEEAIQRAGSAVELLRNSASRPHTLPVVAEHTNWQSEQRAWRESCALMDQSHHMTDLYLKGPDALKLLTHLGVNSFKNFGVNKAKQFIVCSYDGYYIGDVILFHLDDESFNLVGREIVMDWVQYHLEVGGYDAVAERDDNSLVRRDGPPLAFRYELQGPNVAQLMEKVTGGPVPDIKFFNMGEFTIGGHTVRALRHGMAGQPGYELFGPWEQGEEVRSAILEAGKEFGLKQAGAKAYSTANLESGWVPPTLPGIFSGEAMREFRQWLSIKNLGSLGGSFNSDSIEDYYLTPYDLGYGNTVAFDHDFIGREALEKFAQHPEKTKVTLVWNPDDVARAIGSLFTDGPTAKYINLPKARYALYQKDTVLRDGEVVGVSMDCGYLANEQDMVSLATIDTAHSAPGTQVSVVWGENPISAKPHVEPHQQVEIRATVAPVPYSQFARGEYRSR